MDYKEDRQKFTCPSCGKSNVINFWPKNGFWAAKVSDRIKQILILCVLGYFSFSIFVLVLMSMPMRSSHRWYELLVNPPLLPTPEWLQPLFKEPAFQIVIGLGFFLPLLIYHVDWWLETIHKWREGREPKVPIIKSSWWRLDRHTRRYQCSYCGHEWNESTG
jgi:predicted RNA-binding Zn-ribbon protein involved in translation (DUF1610 family)